MRTYRQLFHAPEFTPLFATTAVHLAALTVQGLALGTLVHRATGSPLLTALSMFGGSFAHAIGATLLMSAADRLRPRAGLTAAPLVCAGAALLLAVPGAPMWTALPLVLVTGLVGSVTGGLRWGLLLRVLPAEGYVLGRSVLAVAGGATQVGGYAAGGLLVAAVSPRGALLLSAALFLASAAVARLGLRDRPAPGAGRPSVRETWRVNRRLWSAAERRYVYLALWLPNGLIVGCEALFVPWSPGAAGVLFAASAFGMLAGDVTLGRFVPAARRPALITPLRLLLAAPFLLFALPAAWRLPLPLAAALVALACTGFSASLLLQERLIALTPEEIRGQALGLQAAGTMTMQAVGATLAGAVAQWLPPGQAMGVMAAASLVISLALTPGLVRPPRTPPTPDRSRSAADRRPAS
ncbi:MFS transporter [Streptomyces marincola]|uniref:MFS transporter n=1 Tax=Streptomyces marincola TaxID=2878388 RepID=A0A1W7CYP6_9ACTN|nr:MFS transporter [Streptomyces marincola]ARQ69450.1 MFS transporter [Streptomyces marincola]